MRYGSRHKNDGYSYESISAVSPSFEAPAEIWVGRGDHEQDSDHIAGHGIRSANVGH
jgi:hypothetical protein